MQGGFLRFIITSNDMIVAASLPTFPGLGRKPATLIIALMRPLLDDD